MKFTLRRSEPLERIGGKDAGVLRHEEQALYDTVIIAIALGLNVIRNITVIRFLSLASILYGHASGEASMNIAYKGFVLKI